MPVEVSTGVLGQIIASLLHGAGDNPIEELILNKIKDVGKEKIKELIQETPLGEPLGQAREFKERFMGAIESGGATEFRRVRNQWLNDLKKSLDYKRSGQSATRFAKKIDDFFQQAAQDQGRPKGGYWKWSRSRQEWLDEGWRHDWRSQPRNLIGRWVPGRLNFIYVSPRLKKIRSARRRAVRKQVKEMFRGR